MDAGAALTELTELSAQIEEAAIVGESGFVLASTADDPSRGEALARIGAGLLDAAAEVRRDGTAVTRVEVALGGGSVFVVHEVGRTIVATTVADPTPGLVIYDLRTALRRLDEPDA